MVICVERADTTVGFDAASAASGRFVRVRKTRWLTPGAKETARIGGRVCRRMLAALALIAVLAVGVITIVLFRAKA